VVNFSQTADLCWNVATQTSQHAVAHRGSLIRDLQNSVTTILQVN